MRKRNRKTLAALLPAVAGAGAVIAAGFGGNALGSYINGAPQIGHIIAFDPSSETAGGPRIVVGRQDGSTCVLDLGVMRRFGGSLVVETGVLDASGEFLVHWAGRMTSNEVADCGSDAMIKVGRHDLDTLASSAGGYVVGQESALIGALIADRASDSGPHANPLKN